VLQPFLNQGHDGGNANLGGGGGGGGERRRGGGGGRGRQSQVVPSAHPTVKTAHLPLRSREPSREHIYVRLGFRVEDVEGLGVKGLGV